MTHREHVKVGALTFEVETAGEPHHPLVLLLHGFPQTSHTYRHALPALANAGFYAVAPNQRGYSPGARPSVVAEYATPLLVQDALAIADALLAAATQSRFHLVGHDWGGQLAWLLATQHPDRLLSLSVLSRPHPRAFSAALKNDAAQSERSRHHRGFDDPDTANRLLADDARRLKRMLTHQNVAEADAEAYIAPLREPAALDAALSWYRAADRKAAAELPNITVPTLYVWGDADATVGRTAAESTVSCVTAPYRFEVLTGAGHFLTDERPTDTTQLLCEHLGRWQPGA